MPPVKTLIITDNLLACELARELDQRHQPHHADRERERRCIGQDGAAIFAKGHGGEARRFIDEHLMQWLPRFAGRVTERASTRFYAALAGLTLQVVESLQQRLPASG